MTTTPGQWIALHIVAPIWGKVLQTTRLVGASAVETGRSAAVAEVAAAAAAARRGAETAAAAAGTDGTHRSGRWTTRGDHCRAPCASGCPSSCSGNGKYARKSSWGRCCNAICHCEPRQLVAGWSSSTYGWRCRNWRAWRMSAQRKKDKNYTASPSFLPPSISIEGRYQRYHTLSERYHTISISVTKFMKA